MNQQYEIARRCFLINISSIGHCERSFEFEYFISFCRVSEYLVGLKRKNRSLAARLSKNALNSILSLSSSLELKKHLQIVCKN